jgi:hypothetical protein
MEHSNFSTKRYEIEPRLALGGGWSLHLLSTDPETADTAKICCICGPWFAAGWVIHCVNRPRQC